MRKSLCLVLGLTLASVLLSSFARAEIRGAYLETRTAEVYTGQCFANGEVNLIGNEAIMAWRIDSGAWNGVRLDGLSVVAAVRAENTLGDYYHETNPAKAVLLVDDRGTAEQRKALASFARHMGEKVFTEVASVEAAPVIMEVPENVHQNGRARLQAGTIATIETRGVNGRDHVCGNEVTFYPPLIDVEHAMPAVALTDSYTGKGLGETWTVHDKRSAFVGSFSVR